jgi:hypothetical protein
MTDNFIYDITEINEAEFHHIKPKCVSVCSTGIYNDPFNEELFNIYKAIYEEEKLKLKLIKSNLNQI